MAETAASDSNVTLACSFGDVPVLTVGPQRNVFDVTHHGDVLAIRPSTPLRRRHTIRPIALFAHPGGYHDLNTVMGRLVFADSGEEPQHYRPFTQDARRQLRAIFLPVETMPEDEWAVSVTRWQNCCSVARLLLSTAGVPWRPPALAELETLVNFVPWPEPIEGCLLHALTQWTCRLGHAVVEIGSFRGRSTSMLALALAGAGSDSALVCIDPHDQQPCNKEHVRLALRQLGEEHRLVQILRRSDAAAALLRDGMASLVFIDGDHSYQQVVSDFMHYRDLLAVGGCMVFHDYGYGDHNGRADACPDVRRAVNDHVLGDPAFDPLLLAQTQFAFVKTC